MRTEEETRAAAHRAKLQRHERLRLGYERALAGSPAEKRELEAAWEPWLTWAGFEPRVYVEEDDEAAGGVVRN